MDLYQNTTPFSPHKNPYENNGEPFDNQLINKNKHYDKFFYVEGYYRHN